MKKRKNKFIGVILAAGMGDRLGKITKSTPKPLIRVNRKPLIWYTINFMKEMGVSDVLVIGGYQFEKLKKKVKQIDSRVKVIKNPEFEKGNIFSLISAMPEIKNSFLLANADHIYKKFIQGLVLRNLQGITAFCDFDRNLGRDDMKVQVKDDKLLNISKTLTEFDGGYVGMTYCNKKYLSQYFAVAKNLKDKEKDSVVENILKELVSRGLVRISDISSQGWLEIDTPEELKRAEKIVSKNLRYFI